MVEPMAGARATLPIARMEAASGEVTEVRVRAGVVLILIPGAPPTELCFGPALARKFAAAVAVAAARAEESLNTSG